MLGRNHWWFFFHFGLFVRPDQLRRRAGFSGGQHRIVFARVHGPGLIFQCIFDVYGSLDFGNAFLNLVLDIVCRRLELSHPFTNDTGHFRDFLAPEKNDDNKDNHQNLAGADAFEKK